MNELWECLKSSYIFVIIIKVIDVWCVLTNIRQNAIISHVSILILLILTIGFVWLIRYAQRRQLREKYYFAKKPKPEKDKSTMGKAWEAQAKAIKIYNDKYPSLKVGE